jgi:general secretion pathway protein G
MIVLVILSLVGAVVSMQVFQQFDRAKVDVAELQLRQIQSALLLYEVDLRQLPTSEAGLGALLEQGAAGSQWRGPYLKSASALIDPWGQSITYELEGTGYRLRSTGPDKREGGEGADADIELGSTD